MRIQEGDLVTLWRVAEESENLCSCQVEVINMPRGEGDLLQVKHKDGMIEALNPYGKYFDSITKP